MQFYPFMTETQRINNIISKNAPMTDVEFWEKEIQEWLDSPVRSDILVAERYYNGDHDILHSVRTVIGKNGEKEKAENMPDNHIVDNQYGKCVDEKKNYIIAKPLTITTANEAYGKKLRKTYFNKATHRKLNRVARECINAGVAYLYPYYDGKGSLCFKHYRTWEIIPQYIDEERTILQSFGRLYQVEGYEGSQRKTYKLFEIYDKNGVSRYILDGTRLVKDVERGDSAYITLPTGDLDNPGEMTYNWGRVPLIVFKRNEKEQPLIKGLKSLQDAINRIESNFVNVMDEDIRNTILVVVNYDGENLADFRYNLSKYGAVKVSTIDGQAGDVKTLRIEVNPENYKAVLGILKEALVENAKAFNVKDNRLNSDANQMHIQTAYHDMDLDADDMEVEWQAALEDMMYFIDFDMQFKNSGASDEEVTFTFNRNMMIDETSLIQNCVVSRDIISDETIRMKHPWCVDPQKEASLLEKQKATELAYNPIEDMRKAGGINDD